MNWKNVLIVIIVVMALFLLSRLIPYSKQTSSSVNYAPNGFKETINVGINGVVTEIKQEGLFWVTVNHKKLPFSYDMYKLPENWKEFYPQDFIQVGDSIFKNANSDTFYLIRGNQRWQYFLPK